MTESEATPSAPQLPLAEDPMLPVEPAPTADPRTKIRTAIFNTKTQSKVIKVFGVDLEVRQPPVSAILGAEKSNTQIFTMLVRQAYVPGTDILVFDDADVDGLMALPFGDDVQKLISALTELMGADLEKVNASIREGMKSPAQ